VWVNGFLFFQTGEDKEYSDIQKKEKRENGLK
jgi:hypothetical protein